MYIIQDVKPLLQEPKRVQKNFSKNFSNPSEHVRIFRHFYIPLDPAIFMWKRAGEIIWLRVDIVDFFDEKLLTMALLD